MYLHSYIIHGESFSGRKISSTAGYGLLLVSPQGMTNHTSPSEKKYIDSERSERSSTVRE